MVDLKGERLRSWDSCMFYRYTLEASGHNPRPTKLERYRNRLGHKFCYIPEKFDGWIGCSGCGRCIRSCPVSIDIRKVVERLKEEACVCA
jgi:ferredoxin